MQDTSKSNTSNSRVVNSHVQSVYNEASFGKQGRVVLPRFVHHAEGKCLWLGYGAPEEEGQGLMRDWAADVVLDGIFRLAATA